MHSNYINGPNIHNSAAAQTTFITVQRDNAFLPESIGTRMIATGVTSLTMSRWDPEDGKTCTDNRNRTTRLVGGFAGRIGGIKLDGYYQWGRNDNTNVVETTSIIGNFVQAVDAVRGADGAVVCRSTLTSSGNGCVPFNPFGVGAPRQQRSPMSTGPAPPIPARRRRPWR